MSPFRRPNSALTLAEYRRRASRASFTLVETVIALAIMAFLIIEVSAVQGSSIVFSDYSRNISQATWLAKRVMSQVEYYWETKPFPDMENNTPNVPFDDFPEYNYTLDIKEWKFPFEQLLMGNFSGGGGEEEAESEENPMAAMIEQVVKQVFGDEPQFMTANVQVCWSEGAAQNCTQLTHLITNQKKIDDAILALKPVYDKLSKPPDDKKKPSPKPPAGSARPNDTQSQGGSTTGDGTEGDE